ncbi:hypothetical protein [Spirulina sp. 06S082]|uniref:hypothetical protein n=1 Tax=Spirulina sp. 06S082 TaxID=3110248 RepID=UPI002B1F67BB|nr:hypothetical protein [Spirulina sp. 06S082]MEA5469339.1 hypothetical protein [Spirulina sp. 06S082]
MSASDPRRKLVARYSEIEAIAKKIGIEEDDLRAWVSGDNRWNYSRGKAHLLADELGCNIEEIEETLNLPHDEINLEEGEGEENENNLGKRSHLNCFH